ncbi:MAG: hypothetical protein ABIX28_16185 [Vicinamibacterales bacterium]
MSLLNALGRRRHLDDTAFSELWSAAAGGDGTVAAPDTAHLDSCAACRARYEAFTDWLADTRADAIAAADEVFPAERLGAQQSQILRRLAALERPARVIAFPKYAQPVATTHSGPQRWIAAAAAAGLIVGLGAGELLDFRRSSRLRPLPIAEAEPFAAARGAVQPISLNSDDALLYDADLSPRVEALQALDAITPRLRDLEQPR